MRWKILIVTSLAFVALLAVCQPCLGLVQYKKISRESMARIVDGEPDKAIERSLAYLEDHPEDLESFYILAVAYAQKGGIDKSLSYARQAVRLGMPLERFLAGPRDLLEPLTEDAEFKEMAAEHGRQLLHGPMLGCMTDTQATFWVRTHHETAVSVRVWAADVPDEILARAAGTTRADADFTTVLAVDGLEANTLYGYRLSVTNPAESRTGRFRTFPKPGRAAKFEIAFGGGAGYTPEHERIWNAIARKEPLAFLFLGDNVYIDNPTRSAVQRYCYYRRQSQPAYRNLVGRTPIFAVWDDHDFGTDDCWGGPKIDEPAWKVPVWKTFRDNWNNPYYGGGEKQPGCWFDFSIGSVDFFMLDSRCYRDKGRRQGVEVENPSMLGAAQKRWLFDKLAHSKGTFKVLVSQVPWAFGAKPGRGGMDTWEGFAEERNEIFSFLSAHEIEGVILLSADRHRGDVWKIRREGAYPLYEFENSRLTNVHHHKTMPQALFSYNEKCLFGQLSFDTTLGDPEVTYRIVTIDDEVIYAFTIKRSQLSH